MNEKSLNARELAAIKRVAQNVDASYQKVCKLNEKIFELTSQRDELQLEIDEMETPVIRKTGGYKSTDIYEKQVIPQFNENGAPKTDKEGRQLKVTKYVLRYGENVFPVESDPIPPTTENVAGSDFDKDVAGAVDNVVDPVGAITSMPKNNGTLPSWN